MPTPQMAKGKLSYLRVSYQNLKLSADWILWFKHYFNNYLSSSIIYVLWDQKVDKDAFCSQGVFSP